MMIKIFAIKDNKVGAFDKVFVEKNAVQASRALHLAVNDPMIQLSQFPEDFDLYELGEIDDQTGYIKDKGKPIFVVSAISLKKQLKIDKGENNENKFVV